MKPSHYPRLALALACAAFQPLAQAAPVGSGAGLTDLGLFAAGVYTLTGSGTVDICSGLAEIRPDGSPAAPVTCPPIAAYFNPSGSYTADGIYGRAGSNARIGALIGTLNASAYGGNNPTAAQAADWFLIGDAWTLTLTTASHIYAGVNDTHYLDNSGAFDVRVEVSSVPEPASAALMAVALGGWIAAGRRRPAASVQARA